MTKSERSRMIEELCELDTILHAEGDEGLQNFLAGNGINTEHLARFWNERALYYADLSDEGLRARYEKVFRYE